jgi:hypothetical protein
MFSLALILSLLARLSADGCIEKPVLNLLDCGDLSLETVDQLLMHNEKGLGYGNKF